MNLEALHPESTASDEEIAKFEKLISSKLPADFRAYLKEFNGASPIVSPCVATGNNDETDVQTVYGIGPNVPQYASIEYYLDQVPAHLPGSIAVANDSGGNKFWLSLQGVTPGEVHFVHDDWEPISGFIAGSWSDFLKMISKEQDEDGS